MSGPYVGQWVTSKAGGVFSPATSTTIGLEKDGEVIAGVIYENWNGRSIVAHMAATGRLTREFIGAIFRYAFVKCGVDKVILPISSTNAKSNKFAQNLGFTEEARLKDAAADGDVILYTLKKSDCRFLGEEYGKTISTPGT